MGGCFRWRIEEEGLARVGGELAPIMPSFRGTMAVVQYKLGKQSGLFEASQLGEGCPITTRGGIPILWSGACRKLIENGFLLVTY